MRLVDFVAEGLLGGELELHASEQDVWDLAPDPGEEESLFHTDTRTVAGPCSSDPELVGERDGSQEVVRDDAVDRTGPLSPHDGVDVIRIDRRQVGAEDIIAESAVADGGENELLRLGQRIGLGNDHGDRSIQIELDPGLHRIRQLSYSQHNFLLGPGYYPILSILSILLPLSFGLRQAQALCKKTGFPLFLLVS